MMDTVRARSQFYLRYAGNSCLALTLVTSSGCANDDEASGSSTHDSNAEDGDEDGEDFRYTYWRDAKAVIDTRCGGCHRPNDIAPFPLTSFEEVDAVAPIIPGAIESRSMPPWPPTAGCRDYDHDRSLTPDELELLLAWFGDGHPEGNPDDEPDDPPPAPEFEEDLVVTISEPYTPTIEPDDYRCLIAPWDEVEEVFITGYQVQPDAAELVHHVGIAAVAPENIAQLEALDAAEEGPGYTCFGGMGVASSQIGAWAPGGPPTQFPENTGIKVVPGSRIVLQIHYSTLSSAPQADETSVAFTMEPWVDHPLGIVALTNFGWPLGGEPFDIPAGDDDVEFTNVVEFDDSLSSKLDVQLGGEPGDPVVIHQVGLHMHYLGTETSAIVRREDGEEVCGLRIDDWDFNWQGRYVLRDPIEIGMGDSFELRCVYDNSAANQPVINGEIGDPEDVSWGEGTQDEMCLGSFIVSRK